MNPFETGPPPLNPWVTLTISDEGWARIRRFIAKHEVWLEPPCGSVNQEHLFPIDEMLKYYDDEEEQ